MQISKSTVSKALGNKPGVDGETKKTILKYARSEGYFSQTAQYDILLVLPARYKNLCALFQKMLNEAGLEAKCSVYFSEEEYLKILNDAVKNPPCVLALYPLHLPNGESLIKKIDDVWFVGDLLNIENTFYFGAHPEKDAKRLAETFIKSKKTAPIFVNSHKSVVNSRRSEIFARRLAEENIYNIANISLENEQMISAPVLARKLSRFCNNADSVYFGDEVCDLAEKALKKLGAEKMEVFSYNDEEVLKNAVALLIKNAKTFIENGDYPVCKYNFVKQ